MTLIRKNHRDSKHEHQFNIDDVFRYEHLDRYELVESNELFALFDLEENRICELFPNRKEAEKELLRLLENQLYRH